MSILSKQAFIATAAMLALSACGGRRARFDVALTSLPPLGAAGAIYYATSDARLVRVDPAVPSSSSQRLSGVPVEIDALPDGVVVLSSAAKSLDRFDATGKPVTTLALGASFGRCAFATDSLYAVCTYGASSPHAGVRNLNEVAVVDLAGNTVRKLVLDTSSLSPSAVVFSPSGAAPRYAAVLLTGGVAVIDLAHPDRQVKLDLTLGGATLVPAHAVFGTDALHLFLTASGSDDVFAIALTQAADGTLSGHINFLAGGRGPRAIATIASASNSVLVVYASGDAALLDADGRSENELRVSLAQAGSGITVLGLPSSAPSGAPAFPVVLLTGTGDAAYLWDLGARTLGTVPLGAPYRTEALLTSGLALFSHAALPFPDGAAPALTTLAIVRDSASAKLHAKPHTVELDQPLVTSALDADGGAQLFVLRDEPALWRLPLGSAVPDSVQLDTQPRSVGLAGNFAYADAADPFGDVTVIPLGDFQRGSARRIAGFLLMGVVDAASGD